MHKLEQDAWVRASELKGLHKEHGSLVEDNKRLMQQAEALRQAKDRLIEEKTSVMMRLAEVESELKKTGTEVGKRSNELSCLHHHHRPGSADRVGFLFLLFWFLRASSRPRARGPGTKRS